MVKQHFKFGQFEIVIYRIQDFDPAIIFFLDPYPNLKIRS